MTQRHPGSRGSLWARIRSWLERRRRAREVQRLMLAAFRDPELLSGTSLRPAHVARYVVLDHREAGGRVVEIHFGIVRHPRPYSFSPQHHKVLEVYTYDVGARLIRVARGTNLTRSEGRDDD